VDSADLAFAGIGRQAELIRSGDVTPTELVQCYLDRIERLDPQLNAWRTVWAERALAEASQAEARLKAGESGADRPLLGVPVAIKDSTDVAGDVTTHGTGANEKPAAADAEVVRRLRAAGAIPLGKTKLPELAWAAFTETLHWGATRNPWNPAHSTGGSSGGSAAAVASGMVGVAQASDGLGSIRIPAHACRLFGLKPQRGRVSLGPLDEHWHGLSVTGCVSRTVADTAVYLDCVKQSGGDYAKAAATPPGKLRIAVSSKPLVLARVGPEARRVLGEAADLLRSLGHDVREQDPDWGDLTAFLLPRYLHGMWQDAQALEHPERLERRTRQMCSLGRRLGGAPVRWSLSNEAARAARINRIFEDADVVLTPMSTGPPQRVGEWEGHGGLVSFLLMSQRYPYAPVWNLLGQPAASVPAGFSSDGLPMGVQLGGPPDSEERLLSLAAQMEAERPWHERPPVS
jgi:amidase